MGALWEVLHRVRSFFQQEHRDLELDAEVAAHLELAVEENIRHGMSAEEARPRVGDRREYYRLQRRKHDPAAAAAVSRSPATGTYIVEEDDWWRIQHDLFRGRQRRVSAAKPVISSSKRLFRVLLQRQRQADGERAGHGAEGGARVP